MTIHSSILAWEVSWTEEPGGLESIGLQRVGHGLQTKQQQTLFSFFISKRSLEWEGGRQEAEIERN